MSKLTLSMILGILRIVLSFGEKVVRMVYSILDIVDDGVINNSVTRPEWVEKVVNALANIEFALSQLRSVEDEVSVPAKVSQSE